MSDDEQQQEQEYEPEPAPSSAQQEALDRAHSQTARQGSDHCPRCGEKAYHAESICMEGRKFHKRCFSCKACKKKLDSTNACNHEDEVYCKSCHVRNFGPTGYGYGGGAGALTNTGK